MSRSLPEGGDGALWEFRSVSDKSVLNDTDAPIEVPTAPKSKLSFLMEGWGQGLKSLQGEVLLEF